MSDGATVPATLSQVRAMGWDWLAGWTDEEIECAIEFRHFGYWADTDEVCVMDVGGLGSIRGYVAWKKGRALGAGRDLV